MLNNTKKYFRGGLDNVKTAQISHTHRHEHTEYKVTNGSRYVKKTFFTQKKKNKKKRNYVINRKDRLQENQGYKRSSHPELVENQDKKEHLRK